MTEIRPELPGFLKQPFLGILRGITADQLEPVLGCASAGGLRFIEITLNTSDAFSLIRRAVQDSSHQMTVGAGTVLSVEDARQAVDAGATFLVSPTLNEQVADFAVERRVPYFPGAYTPTEIERAWNAGAFLVKVFPAAQLGPSYFRELRGPFPHIRTMAVGGVRSSNVTEFLQAGASAIAVGGSVFSAKRLESGDYDSMQQDLSEILLAVKDFFI